MKQQAGLTLIELMITLAILTVLAGLAIPAYDRYTRKSVRAAAKTELEKVRSLMETYYINNKTCTTDLTNLGYSNAIAYIDKGGNEVAAASGDRAYQIEVDTCTANTRTYSVIARPQLAQTGDTECANITVNYLGQKNASGAKGPKCW